MSLLPFSKYNFAFRANIQAIIHAINSCHYRCYKKNEDGEFCREFFTTEPNLQKHVREMHAEPGEDGDIGLKCDVCGKTGFHGKGALKQHKREQHENPDLKKDPSE